VVEARREDWTRDPYTFIEENGFFYARGVADMKAMDAIWVDTLIRMRRAGETPRRTIKVALTCGEESASGALNGARWLVENRPDLIDSEFVLTEGGGGRVSAAGAREVVNLQVGEKAAQDFKLEVTNPGGHSSRPMPDNAIYRLADALEKIRGHTFPVHFTETTKVALQVRAKQNDPVGKALVRLLANPADAKAAAEASADPSVNAVLRTTCVATRLDAGHATNALPQRATANVNCRIFPGETVEGTLQTLVRVIGDPKVAVTYNAAVRPLAVSPPLTPRVVEPAQRLAAKHFPGVAFTPMMMTGATDGRYFGAAKIPVYGAPGLLTDAESNTHGLNERIPVRSVYEGRDYLYELVREYAAQGPPG
jgi:acetylornithine deacetylase/succinyl-diaminopimelate desuccinylase-like protein